MSREEQIQELLKAYELYKDVQPPDYVICNDEMRFFKLEEITFGQYHECMIHLQSAEGGEVNAERELAVLNGYLGVLFGVADYTKYDRDNLHDLFTSVTAYLLKYRIKELRELRQPPVPALRQRAIEYAAAEIGDIESMGLWVTIDHISQRQVISHDAVQDLRYTNVFFMLKIDTIRAWIDYKEGELNRVKK